MECYLDNSATTRCLDSAAALMAGILCTDYGNPSSLHHKGVQAEEYVRHAREVIAKTLKVTPKEIFFTSGGTESDNLALRGAAYANARQGKHLITTSIEHPAILNTMQYLEQQGFEVTYLPVDENGKIRLSDLEAAIRPDTILVSIMHTNNEIGALEPIAEAGELIKRVNPNTLFHVDAVQGYGKAKILPKRMKIDMLSVSGHKIHGPKGTGFLYVKEKTKIKPIILGGGQQKAMRSGTENVPGIAGLGVAAGLIYNSAFDEKIQKMYDLRSYFIEELQKLPDVTINGCMGRESAPHIVSASFRGVRAEVLLHALEDRKIYVSSGSACSSNKPGLSNTLVAIHLDPDLLDSTIRFSFSFETTKEELDMTLEVLKEQLPVLRKYTRH